MDDLTQQLQKVLSDPQTMGQLQGLLSSLGGQEEKPAPAPSGGPDLSALLGALGGGQASPPPAESPSTALAGLNPQALSLMARLGPLLSQANREDDATRLLRALLEDPSPPAVSGAEALVRQAARNRALLARIVAADRALNQKVAGRSSFYAKRS